MSYWKDKYKQDIITTITVALIPFFIFVHLLFSNESSEIIIFTHIFNHGLRNNQVFIWILLSNFIPLLLLLIMFLTTSAYWKYFLFPLMAFYLVGVFITLEFFTSFYNGFTSIRGIALVIIFSTVVLIFDQFLFQTYRQKIIHLKFRSLIQDNFENKFKLITKEIGYIRKEKIEIPLIHYLKKIYYLKLVLSNNLRIDPQELIFIRKRKGHKIDIIIIIFLFINTGIWFIAYQIPQGIMEMKFMGIEITSNGFNDVRLFIWFVSRKLIVVMFLSIWFISCQHWWKYAILSPLVLYSYQFWEPFQDVTHIDAIGNLKVFPLAFITILVVVLLSKIVKYQTDILIFYESINNEIEQILNELKNMNLEENILTYANLREFSATYPEQKYLQKLIKLKNELLKKLKLER